MKIIGCGNVDRGDDAAGLLVARRLREWGIDAVEECGGGFALIDSWAGAGDVVLVDAVVSGRPPGSITVWDAGMSPPPADRRTSSSHGFGVAQAVRLARVLGRMPRSLIIYGIEGRNFDLGSAASAEVIEASESVARRLAATASCTCSPPPAGFC